MLQNYVMNASLYSHWLRFTKQKQTLYPGKPNNGKSLVRKFEIEVQILKMTLHQKSGHGFKTPSSKLAFVVSSCWEKNFIRDNAHKYFILSLVLLKLLIVSVAFFLGHPVKHTQVKLCSIIVHVWVFNLVFNSCTVHACLTQTEGDYSTIWNNKIAAIHIFFHPTHHLLAYMYFLQFLFEY